MRQWDSDEDNYILSITIIRSNNRISGCEGKASVFILTVSSCSSSVGQTILFRFSFRPMKQLNFYCLFLNLLLLLSCLTFLLAPLPLYVFQINVSICTRALPSPPFLCLSFTNLFSAFKKMLSHIAACTNFEHTQTHMPKASHAVLPSELLAGLSEHERCLTP